MKWLWIQTGGRVWGDQEINNNGNLCYFGLEGIKISAQNSYTSLAVILFSVHLFHLSWPITWDSLFGFGIFGWLLIATSLYLLAGARCPPPVAVPISVLPTGTCVGFVFLRVMGEKWHAEWLFWNFRCFWKGLREKKQETFPLYYCRVQIKQQSFLRQWLL